MPIQAGELATQRMLTRYFIDADSTEIDLERSLRTPDGAGGIEISDPAPVGTQTMRLIPQGASGADSRQRTTADGEQVTPDYVLMALWDADIERWDTFEQDGRRYEVVFVNQNRQYEIKAEVVYRGELL